MTDYAVRSAPWVVVDVGEKRLIRVLHVDDEQGFLKLTKQMLEATGDFRVDTALSVREALERVERNEYDVVVSDYKMPERDGLDFLRELRGRGCDVPFIMFTGRGTKEVAISALNLGASRYLSTMGDPVTVYAELAQGIREVVGVRKAGLKLLESEARFRSIFENANDCIVCIDGSGMICDVNKRAVEAFGGTREELVGKMFYELDLLGSGMKSLLDRFHQAVAGIISRDDMLEVQVNNKRGQRLWFECSVSLVRSDDEAAGLIVIARDVTDRRRAEQRFLESQQRFEGLFFGNPEASVLLDPNFVVLDINSRFGELFGFSLEEVRGRRLDDLIVPRERAEEAQRLDDKAVEGYVYQGTVRMRKGGELVPVSVSAAPIVVDGRLRGYVGMYRDISDLKSTEAAMKEMMQKLTMMNEKLRVVGGLTRHDVRNKLLIITGNIYLAKKRVKDNPEVLESLGEMQSACKQIVRIFDLAKDYEMLGVEELTWVNVEEAVRKAAALFSDTRGVAVVSQCAGLTVLADSLLRQLFYNLIDNSLKYGEKTTQIRVFYEKGEDEVRIVYEDDGVGIPDSVKPKIFLEGFTTGKGSGYGLYLVRKMMEVYGWTIKETGQPGNGARFKMTIQRLNNDGKTNYKLS